MLRLFLYVILLPLSIVFSVPVLGQDFRCNYTTDIDHDNDGLIEICDLDALNAIRYQLDGSGYRASYSEEKNSDGCPQSGCIGYELRRNLDFADPASYRNPSNRSAWTSGSGWQPIGDMSNPFSARLEGNGHTISNLFIGNIIGYVGLFTSIAKSGKINDIVLSNPKVSGSSEVGSFAGLNEGIIGNVDVVEGHLKGGGNVGGIVGINRGTVINGNAMLQSVVGGIGELRCRADFRLENCTLADKHEIIVGGGDVIGGIVGLNEEQIVDSFESIGLLLGGSRIGGIVGVNDGDGTITNVESAGTIKGNEYVGGIVGSNRGYITASYAHGNVRSNNAYVGGLVGINRSGEIYDSYASAPVDGNNDVGGLVGVNTDGYITNSYASDANIQGNNNVGGLVGRNESGEITDTYASNSVRGVNRVGGLVGLNKGAINYSYTSSEMVADGDHVGGLIGWGYASRVRVAEDAWVIGSYWDSEASRIEESDGGSPRTTVQLQSPVAPGLLGETFFGWSTDSWDFGSETQYPAVKYRKTSGRGSLLVGQYTRLSDLSLLDGLKLSPAFDAEVFDYRVLANDHIDEIRLRATKTDNTAVRIVASSGIVSSTASGSTATIALNTTPQATLVTIARQYRVRVVRPYVIEAMTEGLHDTTVAEGSRITLDVSEPDPRVRRPRYRWSQISPPQPSLPEGVNVTQAKLSIEVPKDFVGRTATSSEVILQVVVSDGNGTTIKRNIKLTIVKVNNDIGNPSVPVKVSSVFKGDTFLLTVPEINRMILADADGEADPASVRYQWQYKLPSEHAMWADIEEATVASYRVARVEVPNHARYRVRLGYHDGQNYIRSAVSQPISVGAETDRDGDGFTDINYLEDLADLRNQPSGNYELVRDLDFNGVNSYKDLSNKALWTVADYSRADDVGWQPITKFVGTLNGNGHTISNLQINRDGIANQGLFDSIRNRTVINGVSLVNVKIEGGAKSGGLAGSNSGDIINSSVIGTVSGRQQVGGLVGNNHGSIMNSSVIGTISGGTQIGGLVGINRANIVNSRASGKVIGTPVVGGLVGELDRGKVINSYATAQVVGETHVPMLTSNLIGGLVGYSYEAIIRNSYATGSVLSKTNLAVISGLVGDAIGGEVTNSYSIGVVPIYGRGLLHVNHPSPKVSNSYWDTTASMRPPERAGKGGIAKTTAQLQSPTTATGIYEKWSESDWDFGSDRQYPILKYAPNPDADGVSACGASNMPNCGELISPALHYGLSNLILAGNAELSPPFEIEKQNPTGIYVATVKSASRIIRLVPTTIESDARISIYLGDAIIDADITSGTTSSEIVLRDDGITRIIIKTKGTQTARYSLYLNYFAVATDGTILINYLEDLDEIRNNLSGNYRLARDLDFADESSYRYPSNKNKWTVADFGDDTDTGWQPIGTFISSCAHLLSKCFTGNFDGNDYAISNLQINRDGIANQGLFGSISNQAVISDLVLLNVKIEGGARSGGLVGENNGDLVGNYVIGEVAGQNEIGGLVGKNNGNIINSYAGSTILGNWFVGGLVGNNGGTIVNSNTVGEVSGLRASGGLVGSSDGEIINSYATVHLNRSITIGQASIIGGLAGQNFGIVKDSYATGNAAGNQQIGGLVGDNYGNIADSYAIGRMVGSGSGIGGLIGRNNVVNPAARITTAYWDTETSGRQTSAGGFGQTTMQLQAGDARSTTRSIAYYGWSEDNWDFGNNHEYPILKYTQNPIDDSARACGASNLPDCGDLISPSLRYGLRDLKEASNAMSVPPFDADELNRTGIYIGTIINDSNIIRLVPNTVRPAAGIDIYIGGNEETRKPVADNIASGTASGDIELKDDGITRVRVEVKYQSGSAMITVKYLLYLRYKQHRRIDADRDGLIDISYLEDLDAIRYQADGSGYSAGADTAAITVGCPSGKCIGYELLNDLDFNDPASYRNATANMSKWSGTGSWIPIENFSGLFKGNNKTISNLKVRGDGGLFKSLERGVINGVGLLGVNIKGGNIGGIAESCTACSISNSYVIGNLEGVSSGGGLLGNISATNNGEAQIANSYFIGNIILLGNDAVGGGMLSDIDGNVEVSNSYVFGRISGEAHARIGGLIGSYDSGEAEVENSYLSILATTADTSQRLFGYINPDNNVAPTFSASYADIDVAELQDRLVNYKRSEELKSPTMPGGIYAVWHSDNWDFGTSDQYPAIKYNDASCDAVDEQSRAAACHTVLGYQGSPLRSIELSEGAGISEPFSFAKYNYEISVNADRNAIRMTPTAFEPNTTIMLFKDEVFSEEIASGETSKFISLNKQGSTIITMVVNDTARSSYRYRFNLNRLDVVAENIDKDGDGLIEINDTSQFATLQFQLDGSAYRASAGAPKIYCPSGCVGYELVGDIDLSGVDFSPIGNEGNPFVGVFRGNGHVISNLRINKPDSDYVGLFGVVGAKAKIDNVGLVDVELNGRDYSGGLVGLNEGKIINSYVVGEVSGGDKVGGLIGVNHGSVINSYADATVQASGLGGGLAGVNTARITAAYASGRVGTVHGTIGGLAGRNEGQISDSYASGTMSGGNASTVGGLVGDRTGGSASVSDSYFRFSPAVSDTAGGIARTAAALKQATTYTGWQTSDWSFGNNVQYPALLYTVGDATDAACRLPSEQTLSECKSQLSDDGLAAEAKEAICRSHLQKVSGRVPWCGALLGGQRSGLAQLAVEGANLRPMFVPQSVGYVIEIDADTEIRTTATAYYGSDSITIRADGMKRSETNGRGSVPISVIGGERIAIVVKSASNSEDRHYAIDVIRSRKIKVDEDGLIEIEYLEDLDAVRYQSDGSGYRQSGRIPKNTEGCPMKNGSRACRGYKLTRDLDFNDPESYLSGKVNSAWTSGVGWSPIANFSSRFVGGGYTISNLRINRPVGIRSIGLFGLLQSEASIEGVGLLDVAINGTEISETRTSDGVQYISGNLYVGALVGRALTRSKIVNSYALSGAVLGYGITGALVGLHGGVVVNSYADVSVVGKYEHYAFGGLLGSNLGEVRNSYASGTVKGIGTVGGLAGINRGKIIASYASGDVQGDITGGLAGVNGGRLSRISTSYAHGGVAGRHIGGLVARATVSSPDGVPTVVDGSNRVSVSYWDRDESSAPTSAGGTSKTTVELQGPQSAQGIYAEWDESDWDFGTAMQYPILRYTSATSVLGRPACRGEQASSYLPICGSVLPAQRSGLRSLLVSLQVLQLMPAFDPRILKYRVILKSNENEFQMIPMAFNAGAKIVIGDDSGINQPQTINSGDGVTVSLGNADSIALTIVVEGITYKLAVVRHPFIAVNDIDADDDGLIEVSSKAMLDAIRYQLDGSGYRAVGDIGIRVGCPLDAEGEARCRGYELTTDLDLSGMNWQAIGSVATVNDAIGDCNHRDSDCFAALFEGNGYTISNLNINGCNDESECTNGRIGIGLFAALGEDGIVKNVNLSDVAIRGRLAVGSLAGYSEGVIVNSNASGAVVGDSEVGGLIGRNVGMIANSYTLSRASGETKVGGLVGLNLGELANTYASGRVDATSIGGGLVGENRNTIVSSYASASVVADREVGGLVGNDVGGRITNSYWDTVASGVQISASGIGKTTEQLQVGVAQSSDPSEVYYRWDNIDWYFGSGEQYPILKYTVTVGGNNISACGASGQPNCGDVQSYGLASLASAEVVTLVPVFNPTRLDYKLSAETYIKQLHLTPTAIETDAVIRIVSDNGFSETVASGTASSPIALNKVGTTTTEIIVEVVGNTSVRYRLDIAYFSSASARVADADGDGLIEVNTLEDLDAVRDALDGRRYRYRTSNGTYIETVRGCPAIGCKGYELTRDLDFDDLRSYASRRVRGGWTSGRGFSPIGTSDEPFAALFEGNGYAISNLRVNRADARYAGLFGVIDGSERAAGVQRLGLADVNIVGGAYSGGLVGYNKGGVVTANYVSGYVASALPTGVVGGLVGENTASGRIENSYALGIVKGRGKVGGLVAVNSGSGVIATSYAVGRTIGLGNHFVVGGLVGTQLGSAMATDSYWDVEVGIVKTSAGGTAQTTELLQSSNPSFPSNSIYAAWDSGIWDFADKTRYPILKSTLGMPLSGQVGRDALQHLTLSGDALLFPSFNPLIYQYEIVAPVGQLSRIRLNTTPTYTNTSVDIRNGDEVTCFSEYESMCASLSSRSFILDGVNPAEIIVAVRDMLQAKPIRYRLVVNYAEIEIKRVFATTKTTVSSNLIVDEGDELSFRAEHNLEVGRVSYRWRQSGGSSLGLEDVDTSRASLDFTVPPNVVGKDHDSRVVELELEISADGIVYGVKKLSLTINKVNNDDGVGQLVLPVRGDPRNTPRTYTADTSSVEDDDGGIARVDLRWQRCPATEDCSDDTSWTDIEGATAIYTIPSEGDYKYRVVGFYEDQQGYIQKLEAGRIVEYIDIDDDNDGLIEIRYLEELAAIRTDDNSLSGRVYRARPGATPIIGGCGGGVCVGYELTRDLDFNEDASYSSVSNKATWTTGVGWQPIGTSAKPFAAIFKGNGFTVSNLFINRATANDVALFGVVSKDAVIDGLGLADVNVTGSKQVSGLVGENKGAITNSYVAGGRVTGNSGPIGGLIGRNSGAAPIVINSYANVRVIAVSESIRSSVGGLVGLNNGGDISHSYAKGNLSGRCVVGGLVGTHYSTDASKISKITNSYAHGNVTRSGNCTGARYIGGLVGYNDIATVENSYAIGRVLGESGDSLGGLVGINYGSIDTIKNSYWNFDANCEQFIPREMEKSCFGDDITEIDSNARLQYALQSHKVPVTQSSSCMRVSGFRFIYYRCSTYDGWSTDNWDFGTDKQYPVLKYGAGPDANSPACGAGELPDCNLLLGGQVPDSVLLSALSFSENVQLSRDFNPQVFGYDALVESETLPVAIVVTPRFGNNVQVIVKKDGTSLTKRSDGSFATNINTDTTLTIATSDKNDANVRGAIYQVQIGLKHPPQIVVSGVPSSAVDEGSTVVLDASNSFAMNNVRLNYRWSQISGQRLSASVATNATLRFTVPNNFVPRAKTTATVVLRLGLSEVNNLESVASRDISLTINKRDNGNGFGDSAKWISSNTASAPAVLTDPDGGHVAIAYIWFIEKGGVFNEIPGADRQTYTPAEAERNARYKVSIEHTDGQGHNNIWDFILPQYGSIAHFVDKDGDGLIEIESLEDLNAIRHQPDGSGYRRSSTASKITEGCPNNSCRGYELVRDLDFNDNASYKNLNNKQIWTVDEGLEQLDDFTAIFEGNGHTISNLRINYPGISGLGLFGISFGSSAEIRRVGLINVFVRGNNIVGGLAGRFSGNAVIECYVSGIVEGNNNVGGLVGDIRGQINDSYSEATVSGRNSVGGLVGSYTAGNISNSYATGNVIARNVGSGIGGLVGKVDNSLEIRNSYATGDVTGLRGVGGLVGQSRVNRDLVIVRSYASGNVAGNDKVGGLSGSINGSISDSYALGKVAGNSEIGGLVGSGSIKVSKSYWQIDDDNPIGSHNTTATNLNYKGFSGGQLKLPTAAGTMDEEAYYGWSSDHWHFGTPEQYPALKYHDATCNREDSHPNCGKLLLHQRIGLQNIELEQAQLMSSFDPEITAYNVSVRADADSFRLWATPANPDARIMIDGESVSSGSSYSVPLAALPTTTIIQVATGNEATVEYKLVANNFFPKISLSAPDSVAEGELVELIAEITDADGDELHYDWTISSDRLSPVTGAFSGEITESGRVGISFKIPVDLLSAAQDEIDIEIGLTVGDALVSATEKVSLKVIKRDNGSIVTPIPRQAGFTYTIANVYLLDPDGVSEVSQASYQWQHEIRGDWTDIEGATNRSYTLEGIIGDYYRVAIDYTDGQGYRHRRLSESVQVSPRIIYSLTADDDMNLKAAPTLSEGILMQEFDVRRTTHTAVIAEYTTSTIVTAEVENQNAMLRMEVDDETTLSGRRVAKRLRVEEGQSKEIKIIVRAENGRSRTYSLTVLREASPNLEELKLSDLRISEDVSENYDYAASVLTSETTSTIVFIRASNSETSIHSIEANDKEYVIETGIALSRINLTPASKSIPLNINRETVINIVARTPSIFTETGYTERTYTVKIKFSFIFIYFKVLLEGLL